MGKFWRKYEKHLWFLGYLCFMILVDTHAHLYLHHFDHDRDEMILRALDAGVKYMFLPNIDNHTLPDLVDLCQKYTGHLYPMIGLHPTDVKSDWQQELKSIFSNFNRFQFYAIGETGIDLYWDKTFIAEQKEAFRQQIEFARNYHLPVIVHVRESFDEVFEVIESFADTDLKGIFHCFTGNLMQARRAISLGFKLGIGGVITYKNNGLARILPDIGLEHLVLETDSPFLSPEPYRGKRNESAYLTIIAEKLAQIMGTSLVNIARVTTYNALELFGVQNP